VLGAWTLHFRVFKQEDNGDVEFESEKSNYEDIPPLKDCTRDELTLPVEVFFVIRRTF
jgi:hypothetical protein